MLDLSLLVAGKQRSGLGQTICLDTTSSYLPGVWCSMQEFPLWSPYINSIYLGEWNSLQNLADSRCMNGCGC